MKENTVAIGIDPLGVQDFVHRRRTWTGERSHSVEQIDEAIEVEAATLETRPLAGSECGSLIKKEQLGVMA